MSDDRYGASPGYAEGQLLRALGALAEHPDPEVRRLAQRKVERWTAVLKGMSEGTLDVGSRVPVQGTPAWATLEVAHGGFATGRLLAEAEPDDDEQRLLATLSPPEEGETARGRLNRHALSAQGQAALLERLATGRFRVQVPEEAALAVVAWLQTHGDAAAAEVLVETIAPWFNRLRFTLRAAETPLGQGLSAVREPAGEVAAALRGKAPPLQLLRMNETLRVWNPLTDRAVALVLESVEGEPPRVARDAGGSLLRDADGQPVVEGGWPLSRRPPGWDEALAALLADSRTLAQQHRLCQRPRDARYTLGRLLESLGRVLEGAPLPPEAARLRHAVAGFLSRHGAPGSPRLAQVRDAQAKMAAQPALAELAGVLAARLAPFGEQGLPSLDLVAHLTAEDEHPDVPAGVSIPEALLAKARRSLDAPIEELVALGVIPSGEVLAEVLPQMTAQLAAMGIDDPALRRLYAATYGAFRRRRGLLLLNLESQVKVHELPWVSALEPHRSQNQGTRATQRQALEQLCLLNFSAFPETLLPNPLIQEISALAEGAGLKLPIVEEIAADIFMGTFTPKFMEAARLASRVLQGSVYARYYELPDAGAYPDSAAPKRTRWGRPTADAFAKRCADRAAAAQPGVTGGGVAANGVVLEQSQILHTHNLAALFDALELAPRFGPQLIELAQACFTWILRRNAMKVDERRASLQLLKNSAYAWRQMLFYLSMAGPEAEAPFMAWAWQAFTEASEEPRVARLRPAVQGLQAVVDGQRFDAAGQLPGGRRFLGWTLGTHWMLGG